MTEEITNNQSEKEEVEREKKIGIKRRYMAIILIVAGIIGGLYTYNASKYESTDDAYVESHMIQVAPKVTGQIVELYVEDNQRVKEGEVVAVIDKKNIK